MKIILDKSSPACYTIGMMVNSDKLTNNDAPSDVYILHFKQPYWKAGRALCRHYVGYTTLGVDERVNRHRKGQGSLLVKYAHKKLGIDFVVSHVEHFSCRLLARHREQQLKREGNLARHCEVCNGHKDAKSKKGGKAR
jgi:predicted GIY-YIG superfamily endonuclease